MHHLIRISAALTGAALAGFGLPLPALAAPLHAALYKNPGCICCDHYADYLRQNGIDVDVKPTDQLDEMSEQAGVPAAYEGCHLLQLEGYAIEGHVPINAIRKLLAERPAVAAITLPGMPMGSPGMTGTKTGPFKIYAIGKNGGQPGVFDVE